MVAALGGPPAAHTSVKTSWLHRRTVCRRHHIGRQNMKRNQVPSFITTSSREDRLRIPGPSPARCSHGAPSDTPSPTRPHLLKSATAFNANTWGQNSAHMNS